MKSYESINSRAPTGDNEDGEPGGGEEEYRQRVHGEPRSETSLRPPECLFVHVLQHVSTAQHNGPGSLVWTVQLILYK